MDESIGATLRDTREARGLTLEDVERAIRIRAKYLAALEAGEFGAIPSPVQARGFLRNYAQHLGLNPDPLLSQFDAVVKRPPLGKTLTPPARTRPAAPPASVAGRDGDTPSAPPSPSLAGREAGKPPRPFVPPPRPGLAPPQPPPPAPAVPLAAAPRRWRWFSPDLIVAVVIVAALGAFFVWGGSRLASVLFNSSPQPTPLELGRPTDTPTATLTLVALSPTVEPPPPLGSLTEAQVTLNFDQTAWVRVTVDGEEAFSGLVAPGSSQSYAGKSSVEVLTGNGAGVRVIYGGQDQGLLGAFGEVVLRIYTLNGMITATSSPTPEATETFTPAPATDTPTPSRTPARRTTTPSTPTASPTLAPTAAPAAQPRPSETVPPSRTGTP